MEMEQRDIAGRQGRGLGVTETLGAEVFSSEGDGSLYPTAMGSWACTPQFPVTSMKEACVASGGEKVRWQRG